MKSKSYEKYRKARESIKSGESKLVILDDDVTLVSTSLFKEGQKMWNNYILSRRAINGKPN